jgi:uroporphyrinogen III methyltransferase/synthase
VSKRSGTASGTVVFVGAGPGDPGLLTQAAARAIAEADVVLLQRGGIVAPDVLPCTAPVRELHGPTAAAEVVDAARAGQRVARVLVGDPVVDSFGIEEIAACQRADVPFEVVPGVALATAVPTYAGIPIGTADSPVSVTVDGTTVLHGARAELSAQAKTMLSDGVDGDRPVLVVSRGTTPNQVTERTTLGELAETGDGDDLVVAVLPGDEAAAQAPLDWFASRPLLGWRVLVPRTKDQAGTLVQRLARHGALADVVPTISVEPPRNPNQIERALRGLVEGRYAWTVFTSVNALKAVRTRLEAYGLDARAMSGVKVAAVGEKTAQALQAWGITPELVPSGEQSSRGLLADWPPYDDEVDPLNRVFLPRADIATETLAAGLTELGWEAEDVTAYRTVRAAPPPAPIREAIKGGEFDAVLFTSSSTVRNLVGIAGKPHTATVVACIGPQTARTVEEHGMRVDVLAPTPSAEHLADALAAFAEQRREELIAHDEPVTRPSQRRRTAGRRSAASRRRAT